MKRKTPLIMSLTALLLGGIGLTSCDDSNNNIGTTDTNPLDQMLIDISKGYSAQNVYVEEQDFLDSKGEHSFNYSGKVVEIDQNKEFNYVQRYSSFYPDEFVLPEIDGSDPEEELSSTYIFAKNPDENKDIVTTAYLSLANEIVYNDVSNALGIKYKWYETFNNYFNLLDSTYFTKSTTNPNDYILDCSNPALNTIYESIADNIYGDFIDTQVESYILHTDGTKITGYEGEFKSFSGAYAHAINIKFKGLVTNIGEDSFESPKPVEGYADEKFDGAMAKLQAGNYKVETKETETYSGQDTIYFVDGESDGGTFVTQRNYRKNGLTEKDITSENLFYCYEDFGNDYTQKLTKIGEEYYYSMSRVHASIEESMLPRFAISSTLFDEVDGSYYLKEELPYYFVLGDTSEFSLFKSNYFDQDGLEIILNEDGTVTFNTVYKTSFSTKKEETEYSKIGEVTSLNPGNDKMHEKTTDLKTLKDFYYSKDEYEKAKNLVGEDILNLIHLPEESMKISELSSVTDLTTSKVQIAFLLDIYGDPDYQFDEFIVNTTNNLVKNGFSYDSSDFSGYSFNKTKTYGEVDKNVSFSFGLGNSGSAFVIDIALEDIA